MQAPGEDGGCGGAVSCLVVGVACHILHQTCPYVVKSVFQLYRLGNCHTILGDLRAPPRLLDDNITTLGGGGGGGGGGGWEM